MSSPDARQSAPIWQDFIGNKFACVLPVFSAQACAAVDEVTRSIIHLLRQVIKCCHSLPKLWLIIAAVQAVFPASRSSHLTDQDMHPKERHTFWCHCVSQHYTVKSPAFLPFFFPPLINKCMFFPITWDSDHQI